jgi:hypothetical protein
MIITRFKDFAGRLNEGRSDTVAASLGIDPGNPDLRKIKDMLVKYNRMGLFEWFCKRRFVDGSKMADISSAIEKIETDRDTVRLMSKPIHTLSSLKELKDEMESTVISKTLSRLPSPQRDFPEPGNPESGYWVYWIGRLPKELKGLPLNRDRTAAWVTDRKVLIDLDKFEGAKAFYSRAGRYKDREQLLAAACSQMYLKPASWSDLQKIIAKSGATPRFSSKESGLVILAADFEQTRRLAAHSNWCILGDESWKTTVKTELYVQWIIFLMDFSDKYSLVGTTTAVAPTTGEFAHTETRLKNDEPIPISDLRAMIEERGAPSGFFKDTHMEVLRERFAKKRSLDEVALAPLIAVGMTEEEIAGRKKRFTVKDLPSITDRLASLIKPGTLDDLARERATIIEDFRNRLPHGEFVSKRTGNLVRSLRDEFDRVDPDMRGKIEDLVIRSHDNKYYDLTLSAKTDYDSLGDLLDQMHMTSQTSGM